LKFKNLIALISSLLLLNLTVSIIPAKTEHTLASVSSTWVFCEYDEDWQSTNYTITGDDVIAGGGPPEGTFEIYGNITNQWWAANYEVYKNSILAKSGYFDMNVCANPNLGSINAHTGDIITLKVKNSSPSCRLVKISCGFTSTSALYLGL
jgi:hypothetical protein